MWVYTGDGAIGETFLKLLPGPIMGVKDPRVEAMAAYVISSIGDQWFGAEGAPDQDVLAMGEFDGDGTPDLAFSYYGPIPGNTGGIAWVLGSPLLTAPIRDVLTSNVDGTGVGRLLGYSSGVLTVPDMNGDGYDESAFTGESDYTPGGVVLLQYGPPPAGPFGEECISITLTDEGPDAAGAASELWTGDLDGDDVPDLVAHGGSTYVFYGPIATGIGDVADADAIMPGDNQLAVADFDADGYDDVALGNPFGSGVVYILRGGWE
jgi:hypothetical protein